MMFSCEIDFFFFFINDEGSTDFFALNHYTTRLCTTGKISSPYTFDHDVNVKVETDPNWTTCKADWLKVRLLY